MTIEFIKTLAQIVSVLQMILSAMLMILLIPKTTRVNYAVRTFHESGFFGSYQDALKAYNLVTYVSILLHVVLFYVIRLTLLYTYAYYAVPS